MRFVIWVFGVGCSKNQFGKMGHNSFIYFFNNSYFQRFKNMGSWTANRLRAMLCGRLSIDEINIISEKHGGPDTMFAMVRSLDEEQAKIFLYNILNEGLSARLSAFAETVNVSENDLQQVIDH